MVVGAFPIVKLGVLAVKQISKPIAIRIKLAAKNHQFVRRYFVIGPAQLYHRWETTAKMLMLGLGRPQTIQPLSEQAAVELGGDMLSEAIVFGIGAGALIFEYNRQSESAKRKEEALMDRLTDIESRLQDASMVAEQHAAEIRQLEHNLAYYSSPVARLKSILPGGSGQAGAAAAAHGKHELDADVRNPPKAPPPPPSPTTSTDKTSENGSAWTVVSQPTQQIATPQRSTSLLDASMTEGKRAIGIER